MIAKHNLMVSGTFNVDDDNYMIYNETDTNYGKQDESAIGCYFVGNHSWSTTNIGTTAFLTSGLDYETSLLKKYCDEYKKILINKNGLSIEVDTPTVDDILKFGDAISPTSPYLGIRNLKFSVNGSFWTKTTTSTSIYRVGDYIEDDGNARLDLNVSDNRSYNCYQYYGIRPVVTLPKSYL